MFVELTRDSMGVSEQCRGVWRERGSPVLRQAMLLPCYAHSSTKIGYAATRSSASFHSLRSHSTDPRSLRPSGISRDPFLALLALDDKYRDLLHSTKGAEVVIPAGSYDGAMKCPVLNKGVPIADRQCAVPAIVVRFCYEMSGTVNACAMPGPGTGCVGTVLPRCYEMSGTDAGEPVCLDAFVALGRMAQQEEHARVRERDRHRHRHRHRRTCTCTRTRTDTDTDTCTGTQTQT
eukprot:3615553-Rhodomonas_salina.3